MQENNDPNPQLKRADSNGHGAPRLLLFVALIVLIFLTLYSARLSYAALLRNDAASTSDLAAGLAATSDAVRLNPGDADAHLLLGVMLEANDDRRAAIIRYQTAADLRPADYVLWLQLGRAQELEGESAAAISSAQNAVSLAPFYAQPHWQLGNNLVRAGQTELGFRHLSLAGATDHTLLPPIIDLAWQISTGDVEFVKRAIEPRTPAQYLALADHFKKRGRIAAAISMFRGAAESGGEKEAASARKQYLAELIAMKKFKDAYELWSLTHGAGRSAEMIIDAGFEEEIQLDEPGFGWQVTRTEKTVTLSLDDSNPKEGHSSLRIDFNGNSVPNLSIVSQLIVLEPKTRYQLSMGFRTANLISGGLPTMLILEPNNKQVLGQTDAFPQTTNGWGTTSIDFTTGESTEAVQIALQRKPCSTQPCPIFGKLWLDDFSLRGF